jgi:hypothetical protein
MSDYGLFYRPPNSAKKASSGLAGNNKNQPVFRLKVVRRRSILHRWVALKEIDK